jgi:hypothetical protein
LVNLTRMDARVRVIESRAVLLTTVISFVRRSRRYSFCAFSRRSRLSPQYRRTQPPRHGVSEMACETAQSDMLPG